MAAQEKHYARALARAARGKTETEINTLADRLVALLRAERKIGLLPAIARELRRLSTGSFPEAELIVAGEADIPAARAEIASRYGARGAEQVPVRVDPTLIGGYRYRVGGREIDASAKGALILMHERLRDAAHSI